MITNLNSSCKKKSEGKNKDFDGATDHIQDPDTDTYINKVTVEFGSKLLIIIIPFTID